MESNALESNDTAHHVLIALERVPLRRQIQNELSRLGYDVTVVGGGRQLLGFLRAAVMQYHDLGGAIPSIVPDAIVTDARMPRSAGVDALDQLRNLTRVRVVLIADFADEGVRRYARWHDALVVDEPFDDELLLSSIVDAVSPEWDDLDQDDDDDDDLLHDGYSSIRPRQHGGSRRAPPY